MSIKKGYWNSNALANPAMRSRDDSYSIVKLGNGESWDIDSAMTNIESSGSNKIHICTLNKDTYTDAAIDTLLENFGATLELTIDSSTFVITAILKNKDGTTLGTPQTIDLPLESVVVSGSYDNATKSLILTLENGNTITIPIADLISGLQEEITVDNKLDADLVDDSTSTNKFVTVSDITNWNGHIVNTNNPHNVTKTQVGLGNVDNTSDADKPISTATQDALDLKANTADLGTAAYTDSTDYATAAQGGKADTALQPGDNVSELVNNAGYLTQHQTLADLGITATASEINVLDGITASTTELNYVDGVTSNIQTQIDSKQATINDLTTIRSGAALGATAVQPGDLATVATTGSYNDLSDKPTIPSLSNRVNGAPLSNSASVFYGTSSTAAATVEKVVSIPSITTLDVGTVIVVQPTVTSTVANSTIKLNNFAAYPMRYNNAAITTSTDSIVWNAAYPSVWVFDGTYWYFVAHGIDTNTTYGSMSVSEGTTGTATSNRVVRADYLKQIIQGTTLTDIDVTTTGAVTDTDSITGGIGKLQATKADKSEIPTVNNPTITITQGGVTKGSFTLNQATGDTIALDAGGGVGNIDNVTITTNADDEIQAVATINANSAVGATNPIYDWVGTLAEYTTQDIENQHPDWVCYITDDTEADEYEAYTKSQSNNLFVAKAHEVIEFQAPTAANNYMWYRKYADGWVEQGGVVSGGTSQTITLPVVMADEYYSILLGNRSGTYEQIRVDSQTATTLVLKNSNSGGTVSAYWQVSGMAA